MNGMPDIVRQLQSLDPAALKLPQLFQYSLWAGAFVITVLLMRMLVTRWGDSNVTAKAVVLSALTHMLAGVWTTTVFLMPRNEQGEVRVRVSRLPEPPATVPLAARPVESAKPAWERLQSIPKSRAERTRQPARQLVNEVVEKTEPTLDMTPALPEVAPSPESAVHETTPKPVAEERQRLAPKALPMSIGEQTAESRADTADEPTRERTLTAAPRDSRPVERMSGAAEVPENAATVDAAKLNPSQPPMTAKTDVPQPQIVESNLPERSKPLMKSKAGPIGDVSGASADAPAEPATGGKFARTRPSTSKPAGGGKGGAVAREPVQRTEAGTELATTTGSQLMTGSALPGLGEIEAKVLEPEGAVGFGKLNSKVPAKYRLRGAANRQAIAKSLGASDGSERAVEAALEWLARHQSADGRWDGDGFDAQCPVGERCAGRSGLGHEPEQIALQGAQLQLRQRAGIEADAGLTGLALLAFLGAGYTHMDGIYADTVDHGLRWLIRRQRADGYLGVTRNRYAAMYCHGMATIALGEAYGMTHDETLREPLELAAAFIVSMQNPIDGGWRYRETGDADELRSSSDMSMFGWQLMALKSVETVGLPVPRKTLDLARNFLQKSGRGEKGGLAAYGQPKGGTGIQLDQRIKASMTAEALFCKQLLGMPRTDPAAEEAVTYLQERLPRRSQMDLYYWYYGTLSMYKHGGEEWNNWNDALRDTLVSEQRKGGHVGGSWDPYAPWGDFGGRIFSTAVSTLCLEVYYRYLPLSTAGSNLPKN